jgi:hypothetical protein
MTIDEDYYLCVAYVNVSENPIYGNNQTGDNFWHEICNRYNDLADQHLGPKQEYVVRSVTALRNRFKKVISPQVMTFNRFWKEARTPLKSGWTETMYQNKAKELFLAFTKKSFQYERCCPVLHKMPKFNPESLNLITNEENIMTDSDAPSSRQSPVNAVGEIMGQNVERPQGNKAAKLSKYRPEVSVRVMQEQLSAIRGLNSATTDLSKSIRDKASQESDMLLAMMNFKMGKTVESEYHMTMASERGERWRQREKKEAGDEEEANDEDET